MTTIDITEDLEMIIYAVHEPTKGHTITPTYQDMFNALIIIESLARESIKQLSAIPQGVTE